MKYFLALATCVATPALADVTFNYENFEVTRNGAAELVLRFNNDTDRVVTYVKAECAFLDTDGRALTTGIVNAENISPRSHAYGKWFVQKDARVKQADCRIDTIDYAP